MATRVELAAELGSLTARAEGPDFGRNEFLDAFVRLAGGDAGVLVVGEGGTVRLASKGLRPEPLAGSLDGLVPSFLADRRIGLSAGPVDPAAIARLRPNLDPPATPWALSLVTADAEGPTALLSVLWCHPPGDAVDALIEVLGSLHSRLERALDELGALSADDTVEGLSAPPSPIWRRCNVPLLYLSEDGVVLAANPAAKRKIELDAETLGLPKELNDRVLERLKVLSTMGGLPAGTSGDYSYLAEAGGNTVRIGIAPVEAGNAHWLLSVERGGPSLAERIERAMDNYALTPREADILACLTEGMSNKAMAAQLGISEPTVKFHLTSLTRKTGTSSRTELLALFYSLELR
jgi:DNA-binding CsgD family transcriptional regulator